MNLSCYCYSDILLLCDQACCIDSTLSQPLEMILGYHVEKEFVSEDYMQLFRLVDSVVFCCSVWMSLYFRSFVDPLSETGQLQWAHIESSSPTFDFCPYPI
jgi:hypothetical protein